MMLDLRVSNQRFLGFYIYKEKDGFSVGKNGTSIHTFIKRSNSQKRDILNFIYKNK